jgi:hypothetical protein
MMRTGNVAFGSWITKFLGHWCQILLSSLSLSVIADAPDFNYLIDILFRGDSGLLTSVIPTS